MNTDQIAAEAAKKLWHHGDAWDYQLVLESFKAAIEKAFNEGHEQGMDDEAMHWIRQKQERAAHASEETRQFRFRVDVGGDWEIATKGNRITAIRRLR